MTDTTNKPPTEAVLAPDVAAPEVVPAQGPQQGKPASLWSDAWKELRRKPSFIISAVIVVLMTVMAAFPTLFTSVDPRDCNLLNALQPPSAEHWFGYDLQGCDYYSRTIHGARNSITIGLVVTFFSTLIAVSLGSIAGYRGGWIDSVLARLADIFFAIPLILAGIVFLNALGTKSVWTVSLVLIVFGWPTMLRLMRSTVLSIRELDYVDAARALGASDWRIITRHVLPNGITPVIVYATITMGVIITAEATLSFLNVGLQLPAISWGLMISVAQNRILEAPHLLFFPGLFLSVTVFSFILMGDALRDALDPKLR
jgi:ABC-type dipeptide/oligopeptide/nickel transport system permease subunit